MTSVRWSSYVALGDSFTEGLWDVLGQDGQPDPELSSWATQNPHDPAGVGLRMRGWADLLVQHLARRRGSPLRYANLAVRGQLLEQIVTSQLQPALDLGPDLVSLVAGGNDFLRPGVDVDDISAQLEEAVQRLRASGADVLMATGFDVKGTTILSATRTRVGLFSANIQSIARRHGAYVLDLWGARCLRDPRAWSADRIHLSAAGHDRVAQGALVALGLEPDDPNWDDLGALHTPLPSRGRLALDAEWVRRHAVPWAARKIRNDYPIRVRQPKFPAYVEVPGD